MNTVEPTSIAYHELTHASHLQRIRNEKGAAWANEYWRALASIESYHFISDKNCYGKKGDYNWQMIALAEGWANYRQWRMSQDYLGYRTGLSSSTDEFPEKYYLIFDVLQQYGCSYSNMEKAISTTYSISVFKSNMKTMYPALSTNIDKLINGYE